MSSRQKHDAKSDVRRYLVRRKNAVRHAVVRGRPLPRRFPCTKIDRRRQLYKKITMFLDHLPLYFLPRHA